MSLFCDGELCVSRLRDMLERWWVIQAYRVGVMVEKAGSRNYGAKIARYRVQTARAVFCYGGSDAGGLALACATTFVTGGGCWYCVRGDAGGGVAVIFQCHDDGWRAWCFACA